MRRARPASIAAQLALAACVAHAGAAHAQPVPGSPPVGVPLRGSVTIEWPGAAPTPARALPALTIAQAARLRRAQDLRLGGLTDRARDTVLALERELPHHPAVTTEHARIEAARQAWAAVLTLLRSERSVQRDSTLGSRELELACERLARPREAALVTIETWAARPGEASWALPILLRLAPLEPRAVIGALRTACDRLPGRGDLARGCALLLSRSGDPAGAAKLLALAEGAEPHVALRQWFAAEALASGVAADSAGAYECLVSLAAEPRTTLQDRMLAARRALDLAARTGRSAEAGPRMMRALPDVPPDGWDPSLLAELARNLRENGHPGDAAALLSSPVMTGVHPLLGIERALALLREGPPERAVGPLDTLARHAPQAVFPLAEAEFFSGRTDSALAHYRRAADDIESPDAVVALERAYLLEDSHDGPALAAFGQLAWERWRGGRERALAIADSLARVLPRTSALHAPALMQLAELHLETHDFAGALLPLAAIADSLPGDRLAPLARQRAGEAYLALGDEHRGLAQLEECLARYPRAWNAPEVRRRVEQLRRESHL